VSPAQFRFARRLIAGESLSIDRFRRQYGPIRSFLAKGYLTARVAGESIWHLTLEAYFRDLGPKYRAEAMREAEA
jgi:hypothetical protein